MKLLTWLIVAASSLSLMGLNSSLSAEELGQGLHEMDYSPAIRDNSLAGLVNWDTLIKDEKGLQSLHAEADQANAHPALNSKCQAFYANGTLLGGCRIVTRLFIRMSKLTTVVAFHTYKSNRPPNVTAGPKTLL